jgi:hypothetical protein
MTNEGGVSLAAAPICRRDGYAPGPHPARLDWRASIDVRYYSTKFRSACDVPTGTSQACPDMNEAANQGGLGMTGARGGAERCRATLQRQELATFKTDLYRSRDTCGNFLRLVRPTRPC